MHGQNLQWGYLWDDWISHEPPSWTWTQLTACNFSNEVYLRQVRVNLPPLHILKKQFILEIVDLIVKKEKKVFRRKLDNTADGKRKLVSSATSSTIVTLYYCNIRLKEELASHLPFAFHDWKVLNFACSFNIAKNLRLTILCGSLTLIYPANVKHKFKGNRFMNHIFSELWTLILDFVSFNEKSLFLPAEYWNS